MSDVHNYAVDDLNEARTIAELGARAMAATKAEYDEMYLVPDGCGGVIVQKTPDLPSHQPRATSRRTVTDAPAFVDYVNRHGGQHTEVWADAKNSRVIGSIDANASNETLTDRFGWEQHKVTLELQHTTSWLEWKRGQEIQNQVAFAEFIEDHAEDIASPPAAVLLEIAQTLHGSSKAQFQSGHRLSNGESQLKYVEEIQGKAGKAGELTIPDEFKIALRPYIGGELYGVTAKLRWRLNGGNVSIFYKLLNLERTLEVAFEDMTKKITEGIEYPVFNGRP